MNSNDKITELLNKLVGSGEYTTADLIFSLLANVVALSALTDNPRLMLSTSIELLQQVEESNYIDKISEKYNRVLQFEGVDDED